MSSGNKLKIELVPCEYVGVVIVATVVLTGETNEVPMSIRIKMNSNAFIYKY